MAVAETRIPLATTAKANHKPFAAQRDPAWTRSEGQGLFRLRDPTALRKMTIEFMELPSPALKFFKRNMNRPALYFGYNRYNRQSFPQRKSQYISTSLPNRPAETR